MVPSSSVGYPLTSHYLDCYYIWYFMWRQWGYLQTVGVGYVYLGQWGEFSISLIFPHQSTEWWVYWIAYSLLKFHQIIRPSFSDYLIGRRLAHEWVNRNTSYWDHAASNVYEISATWIALNLSNWIIKMQCLIGLLLLWTPFLVQYVLHILPTAYGEKMAKNG